MGKPDIAGASIATVRTSRLGNRRESVDPFAFGSGEPGCAGEAAQCVPQRDEVVRYHRDGVA